MTRRAFDTPAASAELSGMSCDISPGCLETCVRDVLSQHTVSPTDPGALTCFPQVRARFHARTLPLSRPRRRLGGYGPVADHADKRTLPARARTGLRGARRPGRPRPCASLADLPSLPCAPRGLDSSRTAGDPRIRRFVTFRVRPCPPRSHRRLLETSPTAAARPGCCRGARRDALYRGCPASGCGSFSDCVPVGHRGEVVAQEGIAPLKVALPALADR